MNTIKPTQVLAALLPLAAAMNAADTPPSPSTPVSNALSDPPGIITKVSATLKEMYDDNVYLQSVTASADHHSLVSIISPALTTDFTGNPLFKGTVSYGADVNIYHSASNETFTKHTGGLKLTGQDGDLGYSFTGGIVVIDGSKTSPTYTGPGGSAAIGGPERMSRRAQDIFTTSILVPYTPGKFLVRPVFSSRNQAFHTRESTATGYQNYTDRGEYVGGIDVGYKTSPTLTTFVSYRTGHQYQSNLFGVDNHYENDLNRVLVGLEGALGGWAKINLLFGPDWRKFSHSAVALADKKKVLFYSNSNITFTLSKTDTLTLSYVRFMQPAFGGRNVYEDLNAEAQWRHTVTPKLSGGLGYRIYDGFFETGNRRDTIYYANATLIYKATATGLLTVDYQHATTSTGVPALADTSGRDYKRNQISVSYRFSF